MPTQATRPWESIPAGKRIVPLVVIVLVVAAIGVGATTRGGDHALTRHLWTDAELRALPDNPLLPVTYDEARASGTVGQYDWGEHCDPGDPKAAAPDLRRSRVMVPSVYSPPCVPKWGGAKPWRNRGGQVVTGNGGPTASGVTAKTITIAYYLPAAQDIAAQLNAFGVVDSPRASYEGVKALVEMYNRTYELYGRKVVLKPFSAAGDGRSPAVARADARKVAEDMGAFASIGGPTQTQAYEDELARRGVLCFACGYATTDQQFKSDAPYAWGHLASPDQLLDGILKFGAQSLAGRKARFAGDPAMHTRTRVLGVVHYEQDPPVFGPLEKLSQDRFKAMNVPGPKLIRTYLLDLNSLATQARDIIGDLKRGGVTTVVFLGDPLMPKFLTEQAAEQDYHPEWIITGTVFTDTSAVARLYDQVEWAHAFGVSSAPARVPPDQAESWRLYKWWYGKDPVAKKTMTIEGPIIQDMFIGLQGAGPHLDAKTFGGAMFRYPATPTAGSAVNPKISFGFQSGSKRPDFTAIDDFTFVWWDPVMRGPDENAKVGAGMWRYVFSGVRLPLSKAELPVDALKAIGITDPETLLFNPPLSPAIVEPDANNKPPPYPRRPDSPAAKGG